MKNRIAAIAIPLFGLLVLTPGITSAEGLLLGIALSFIFGNPYLDFTRRYTHRLLALSVVGLGAGMDLNVVMQIGAQGFGYTLAGILFTFSVGFIVGKLMRTPKDTSLLLSTGTAICGGSAIASVSSAIKAKPEEAGVSLAIVFVLNALGLLLFPWIGHSLHLTQSQFGLWSALAIHDTSSVVGAGLRYGPEALAIATTTKLARALWIFPLTIAISVLRQRKLTRLKLPFFIFAFFLAAAVVTYTPSLQPLGHQVEFLAKRLLVLTLFLISLGLTRQTLRSVGISPFLHGVILWVIVAATTLLVIL